MRASAATAAAASPRVDESAHRRRCGVDVKVFIEARQKLRHGTGRCQPALQFFQRTRAIDPAAINTNDAAHARARTAGCLAGHATTHAVADQHDIIETHFVQSPVKRNGTRFDRQRPRRRRVTVTGQVDGQAAMAGRQQRHDVFPVAPITGKSVNEDQNRVTLTMGLSMQHDGILPRNKGVQLHNLIKFERTRRNSSQTRGRFL